MRKLILYYLPALERCLLNLQELLKSLLQSDESTLRICYSFNGIFQIKSERDDVKRVVLIPDQIHQYILSRLNSP